MKRSFPLLILFVGLFVFNVLGQDTLYLKNQQKQNVKILESTHKAVKYQFTNYKNGITFSVNPRRIEKIVYKNGYTDNFGNKNPRKYRPVGISTGVNIPLTDMGISPGMIFINVDYFILPQIDLQATVGAAGDYSYFSMGSNFHLNANSSHSRFTPFTGILIGRDADSYKNYGFVQIPVGISYVAYKGLTASLSMNIMLYFKESAAPSTQLKIGWRFK